MSQNLSLNSYFDPNPRWYFNSLYTICLFSIVFYLQAVYVIWKHSPNTVAKSFKYLLIGHLTTATVFQLNVTVLCPILVYLPFVAGEGIGVMAYFGIGIDHQIVLLFTSILAAISIVVPLFFYRMCCLLPDHHIVNKKVVQHSVHCFMYVASYILPAPFIYLSIHYQDSVEVKKYYEMTYNMTFPNLYSSQVVAIITTNPWAIICCMGVFAAITVQGTTIFGCSYLSYRTLKKTTAAFSITTAKHHINLLKSLIFMIVLISIAILVIVPGIALLFIFNSYRADIVNFLIISGAMIVPSALTSYFINYKPYRDYYLKKIRKLLKIKPKTAVTSTAIISTSPYLSMVQ